MSGTTDSEFDSGPPPPRRLGSALRIMALVAVIGLLAVGLYHVRNVLLARPEYAGREAKVRLVDVDKHLPPDIAQEVLAAVQSAAEGKSLFDDDLARVIHDKAQAQAWIAHVHSVTKHPDGVVAVVADYRRPFALAHSQLALSDELVAVDAEAVVLPLLVDWDLRGKFLSIRDIATRPPAPGTKWDAPDLIDGIKAVKLIQTRPYAKEFSFIDVRNHNGRLDPTDPHVRFWAQVGHGRQTEVRFGRFPSASDDYCVSPAERMRWLDEVVAGNDGRLAGKWDWIELRYDKPYVSDN